jgi:cell division protein ZapE
MKPASRCWRPVKDSTVFSAQMMAGGFRKKYLRATSRLLALSAAVTA